MGTNNNEGRRRGPYSDETNEEIDRGISAAVGRAWTRDDPEDAARAREEIYYRIRERARRFARPRNLAILLGVLFAGYVGYDNYYTHT
jgi:acyl-CoA reductase-like NAD-dependent aldehyde dehydrogenase